MREAAAWCWQARQEVPSETKPPWGYRAINTKSVHWARWWFFQCGTLSKIRLDVAFFPQTRWVSRDSAQRP